MQRRKNVTLSAKTRRLFKTKATTAEEIATEETIGRFYRIAEQR